MKELLARVLDTSQSRKSTDQSRILRELEELRAILYQFVGIQGGADTIGDHSVHFGRQARLCEESAAQMKIAAR